MRKYYLLSIIFLSLTSQIFPQGWFYQSSETVADLNSVHFIDGKTGWAVGDSTLLMTTDGGENWFHQINESNYILHDVFFINSNIGWVAGANSDPSSGPGVLFMTTNSGQDWMIQPYSWLAIKSLHFVNDSIGWGIRGSPGYGIVVKTEDGGANWSSVKDDNYVTFSSLFFVNEDHGWVVGTSLPTYGDYGVIYRTFNGGRTWSGSAYGGRKFNSVYFVDNTGWIVGEGGHIRKIGGGGGSQSSGVYSSLNSVYFVNKDVGWVAGDAGVILKITNGGTNWTLQNVGSNRNLRSVFFTKNSVEPEPGWIVGANGLILSNTTGGILHIGELNTTAPNEYTLFQNYPNPFNPTTTIKYQIPELSFVTLKVYDVLGNEIATLVNEEKPAGNYTVEFRIDNLELSSGIYFYQIRAGNFVETKKMVLLR